jgi:hypothetical protein
MAHTLTSMAAHLAGLAAHIRHLEEELLTEACEIIAEEARRVVGTYDYNWPQLAQSTQDQRTRLGFPPNEPLLRTGELRDSIQWQVGGPGDVRVHGYVGSDNPKAMWNFLGTPAIPARDPILGAAMAMQQRIEHALGQRAEAWLAGVTVTAPRRIY